MPSRKWILFAGISRSGLPSRSWGILTKSCTPCWDGIRPVRTDARAGEQTGEAQKKLSKRIPSRARRSRLGDLISSLPAQPMAHEPWSSDRIKSKFGCSVLRLAINRCPWIVNIMQTDTLAISSLQFLRNHMIVSICRELSVDNLVLRNYYCVCILWRHPNESSQYRNSPCRTVKVRSIPSHSPK